MATHVKTSSSDLSTTFDNTRSPQHSKVTVIPDSCWRCNIPIRSGMYAERHWNKATELCFWCWSRLLNKIMEHRKRSKVKGLPTTLTTTEWSRILRSSQGRCYYCSAYIGYQNLDLEHTIPISSGGGTTASNCVPSCRTCNLERMAGRIRK